MSQLQNAYAIIIGTNHDRDNPLPEVERDAQDLFELLTHPDYCGYKQDNVQLLLNKNAKRKDIHNALDHLIEITSKNSSVLFFYSGHGGNDNDGNSYLLPYDYDAEKGINAIAGKDLRNKLTQINSKRKIVLLDCCHSGGLFQNDNESLLNKNEIKEISKLKSVKKQMNRIESLAQEIDDDQGVAIVTSCQGDQLSYAAPGDQNSIFTKCLKQILTGEHQVYFEDRYINMNETVDYINQKVPELSSKATLGEATQIPYSNLQMSEDFVISYLPKDKWKNIRPSKYRSKVKKDHLKNKDGSLWRTEGNRLLLFIHGFSGDGSDTFGQLPRLLQKNSKMDGWAMKPMGYSAHSNPEFGKTIWASTYDIDRVWRYLKVSIENKFKEYDSIAIIAHSLGGLVAQKAILELNKEHKDRISHLLLFGTPNNGFNKGINSDMNVLKANSDFIATLRQSWKQTFKKNTPFITKVVYALDDEYISKESCYKGFSKEYRSVIAGKHLTMLKSQDEKNDVYELILSTLNSDLEFYNTYTNKEEINLALGNYNAVLKKLLPYYEGEINPDEVYDNEIRQIIFAYEGLGKEDKVFQFLDKMIDYVGDKNDFMGVLGGRYKRSFLKANSQKYGDLSIKYYKKGLELAKKDNNNSQIYYHAINLGFLSIVAKANLVDMKKYATMALEAANKCDDDWKYATIAEANMYLDNLDLAKENYVKALDTADIRGKISMYTNAYAGYVALKQSDAPDDFSDFLKQTLLT